MKRAAQILRHSSAAIRHERLLRYISATPLIPRLICHATVFNRHAPMSPADDVAALPPYRRAQPAVTAPILPAVSEKKFDIMPVARWRFFDFADAATITPIRRHPPLLLPLSRH